jgi:heptosyltransferase-1
LPSNNNLRLLVVRLSAMGDIIHALPAVTALRLANPHAHIAWAVEPAWSPLLAASPSAAPRSPEMPLLDALHLVPFRRWSRAPLLPRTLTELLAARRELRAARYHACLDMQGSLRSAWLALWTRAPRRIGEQHPREAPAKFFFNERVNAAGTHVIEQDLQLAQAVFHQPLAYVPPQFPRDPAAESAINSQLNSALANSAAKKIALLIPGAGWGSKRWPSDRYGAVAAALRDRGFLPIVNSGPGESMLANEVVAASSNSAVALDMSLAQLIALTRRAHLAIGGDTGPLHLASALQVPCVGIFGPTDPARNGPYAAPFRILRHPESVRDHSRHRAPEAGLLTITPAEVLAAAGSLLGTTDSLIAEAAQ